MKAIIGIDPGLGGAVALVDDQHQPVVWDMPCIKVKRGTKKLKGKTVPRIVKELDEDVFADMIEELSYSASHAIVEKVHAMPDQGSASGP